jgi:acetyltransferase
MSAAPSIAAPTAAEVPSLLPALRELLRDAVASGASVGFLPPLGDAEADEYWAGVVAALREGSRVLLVARDDAGTVTGTVQLDLPTRANGLHRAEVAKLLVHRRARRQGLGRALMLALEETARDLGRTTLILDTRDGDPSCLLYEGLGYSRVGVIPQYARSADGTLHATAFYFKLL